MYLNILLCAVLLALPAVSVQKKRKHMVCEEVYEEEEDVDDSFYSQEPELPTPGKYNPSGGKRLEEMSEYRRLLTVVQDLRANMVTRHEMSARFQRMFTQFNFALTTLNAQIKTLMRKDTCELQYNDTCFWAVVHEEQDVSVWLGKKICESRGGKLANIYSIDHYNMIMTYMQWKLPSRLNIAWLWLGMTIDPETRVVSLSDGSPAPIIGWYKGSPHPETNYTQIGFTAHQTLGPGVNHGLINQPPLTANRHGALCQAA